MNTVDQIREALSALPHVSDEELAAVSTLLNKVEQENVIGAAAVTSLQSARKIVEHRYLKRGEKCPLCHRERKHAATCYLCGAVGWDLLDEHEATLRENDHLRAALAQHLPHNGKMIRAGGTYRSLKERARMAREDDRN